MSEEEKKPFLKKAQEDKERYDKELKNYKNKKSDDDAGSAEDGSEDEEDSDWVWTKTEKKNTKKNNQLTDRSTSPYRLIYFRVFA